MRINAICGVIIIVGIVMFVVFIFEERRTLSERCDLEPGYGISLREKEICLLQKIADNLPR